MLLVAAIDLACLPSREELLSRVLLDVGEKRTAWLRQREESAQASIAGVLLLQSLLLSRGGSKEDRLRYDANGKPYLERSRFPISLSHSPAYAVCALEPRSGDTSIGVDVEDLLHRDPAVMKRITDRWFTKDERSDLQVNPTEERFLRIWTGKEAMAKQDGRGLAVLSDCNTACLPRGMCLTRFSVPRGVISLYHSTEQEPPSKVTLMDFNNFQLTGG